MKTAVRTVSYDTLRGVWFVIVMFVVHACVDANN